jgi:molybdate/tungstate transport system ATP-binding protein
MISVTGLSLRAGNFALRDISLEVENRGFFVLLGPTGAGKTLLLEAIAGLVPIESGSVRIDGRDLTSSPPEARGIGIVYQDCALFPHMSVRDNILYGIKFRKKSGANHGELFAQLTGDLDIANLLDRHPGTLSGGELQRVALARALMIEPGVLLLDEPLSALDPRFREEIRVMLKKLHRSTGCTFLMVTHDFAEALSLAGRAAVINNGRIEQQGTIQEIFQKPSSAFVADFVGMKNIFPVSVSGDSVMIGPLLIHADRPFHDGHGFIAIRPEDIVVSNGPLFQAYEILFPASSAQSSTTDFHVKYTSTSRA